jgi:hypothetical protein
MKLRERGDDNTIAISGCLFWVPFYPGRFERGYYKKSGRYGRWIGA